MAESRYRICLIDDEAAVRESIASGAQAAGYETVRFERAHEFLSDFDPQNVFCLVVASSLPGMSGMELLEILRERKTSIPILILTSQANVSLAVQALKSGAMDVLKKPVPADILADRLKQAFAIWSSWQKTEKERQELAKRMALLSPREVEVFHLMADGAKNTTIAMQLGISRKTRDIHRGNVVGKMKARTLADIARWRLLLESGPGGTVSIVPGGYLG
jgi:two-component system, LuxR family, response regulator FixJ